MSIFLEITQLENGDIVLREAREEDEDHDISASIATPAKEPLVRIRFSNEVKDMLGNELVGVAEAMIDAATDYLGSDAIEIEADTSASNPTVH